MMMQGATRHFERSGYSPVDAELKASGLVAQASSDPTFAKLIANSYDEAAMLKNDLTGAQVQVGAMEGRRDYAGDAIARTERGNVATEQGRRTGTNSGQRGRPPRCWVFRLTKPPGELASSTPCRAKRDHRQSRSSQGVLGAMRRRSRALARYRAATDVGTADGATAGQHAKDPASMVERAKRRI